jgi:hypothetical protein
MEHRREALEIIQEIQRQMSTNVPMRYACADIISGVRIVAGLCHYSRREPNAVGRTLRVSAGGPAQPHARHVHHRRSAQWNRIWAYQFVQKCI